MTVLGIPREPQFSPNSVEKDRAILEAVVSRLGGSIYEDDLAAAVSDDPDCSYAGLWLLSMARGEKTLARLKTLESHGARVINSPRGVECCRRSALTRLMRSRHLPVAPEEGSDGWWLKRGDAAAQQPDDVVFCPDAAALSAAKARFRERGIDDYVVQAHVRGDLVKFYGVEGTGFFRCFYPGDDGDWKFGDERRNGRPHHYFFDRGQLQAVAELVSRLALTPVYGGDAVVTPDGDFRIIDFNDWPSFSRCRDEAATAIARLIMNNG